MKEILDDAKEIKKNLFHIQKWNWDYQQAWAFQRSCLNLVNEYPQYKIIITTSHPDVLTNGRGLQKPKKGQTLELTDFDTKLIPHLPLPFFQIERGGGLTFHHPGQFIFYPILKLNPHTLSLSKLVDDLLLFGKLGLEDLGLKDLSPRKELLGLWKENQKLASVGIAIEKLTTLHGMALNLKPFEQIKTILRTFSPCGLSFDTYTSAETLLNKELSLDEFSENFMKKIIQNWP